MRQSLTRLFMRTKLLGTANGLDARGSGVEKSFQLRHGQAISPAVLDSLRTIFKPLRFGTDAHTIPGPLANHGDGTTQCAICLKHDMDPIWVSIDSQRAWECHAHILVRSTPRTDAAGYREPRRLWRCYEVTETYQTVTTIDREVTTIVRFLF